MQLLTTSGYKNIEDCVVGDQLIAYDINDGSIIINELLEKKWMSEDLFEDEYSDAEYDEDGNEIVAPQLIRTKKQIFEETYGELSAYRINNTWDLYWGQSIWANLNVVHAQDLIVGDTIYDGSDNDITISSIDKIAVNGWWRLSVSGDHSYIADDLTLHNASRYWVGGGSSNTWNATGNTNWGSSSGTQDNASVPTSADDVIFDGAGTNGNTSSTITVSLTIFSLNITSGYTNTLTHNAQLTINSNVTLGANYTIAGTSQIVYGNSNSTFTSNGKTWPNNFTIQGSFTFTFVGDFTILGTFINLGRNTVINANTNEKIICNGYSTSPLNSSVQSGTITIEITGGSWFIGNNVGDFTFKELIINGDVTFTGIGLKYGGTKFTYLSGNVTTTGTSIRFDGTQTITNGNIIYNVVTLTGTKTLDKFFTGTPSQICRVSSATGTNYTIQFQDGFEKIARNVAISNATIANRGQLLVITNSRFNTNRSTNIGVRYINQSPNGFAENLAPSKNMAFGAMGLTSDPNFIKQG